MRVVLGWLVAAAPAALVGGIWWVVLRDRPGHRRLAPRGGPEHR